MQLLERIKAVIFGVDPPPPSTIDDQNGDPWLGTRQSTTGYEPEVSTPADDPALDDAASRGVQPVSKPREIEAAQNPGIDPERRPPKLDS